MKKILASAVFAGLAGLTACSMSTPAPVSPAPSEASPGSADRTTQASPSASSPAAAGGVKGACELFNSLYADYQAVLAGDADAYEEIYLESEDAKDVVSGDLGGLFGALSLLAIDHSAAAESGAEPEQASRDAVRDAVFANAGTCTAEGVTLRL